MFTPPGKSEPIQTQTQSCKPSPRPQLTLQHLVLSLSSLNSLQIAIWLWSLGFKSAVCSCKDVGKCESKGKQTDRKR